MTRYTNLGRKKTYLEAEFSNNNAEHTPEDVAEGNTAANLDGERDSQPSQPPAKKRRRVRTKKAEKPSEKAEKKNYDEMAEDAEGKEWYKVVKQAYSSRSREKNRKKEIAKSARSEQRRLERKQEKRAHMTCFACRERGHAAKDCPKVKSGELSDNRTGKTSAVTGICYRCGSSKHTLSRCKKSENPDNRLPYASCYVCSGKGHLASSCPQNKDKGVYPNGGCCKLCGETSHLARNCPTRKQVDEPNSLLVGIGKDVGADEDDFHSLKRVKAEIDAEEQKERKTKKRKRKEQDPELGADDLSEKRVNHGKQTSIPPTIQASQKKVVVF